MRTVARAPIDQQGSVLVTVAVTLVVIGLAYFAKAALETAQRHSGQQAAASTMLTNLDVALANYVAVNRRLPCPAYGTFASTSAFAGLEQVTSPTSGICSLPQQNSGVVPWKTIGVPMSAAIDSYGNWITYRVSPSLTAKFFTPNMSAMDMHNCHTTGGSGVAATPSVPGAYAECSTTICSGTTCTDPNNVLTNAGLPVTDGAGNWLNQPSALSGAAYVLISHGPNTSGAYTVNGTLSAGTGVPAGTSELLNRNALPLMQGSVVANSYRDAQYNAQTNAGANYFDDTVHHPSINAVLTNANLAPRM